MSVALASAVYLSGCGGQDNSTVDIHQEEIPQTVGYKVAAIDEGGYIAPDDIKVVRVEYLLRDISKKTGRNEEVIADQTAKTMQLLRERYGVEVRIATLLEEVKQIVDGTTETDVPTILTLIAMQHAKAGR
ncbi:hypothetical protein F8A86_14415 [Betaproteobacteria bacterium SCN1]|nr:hypothetical protein F8A86_14415 [Betaproteobacteria bacterium SCN1]